MKKSRDILILLVVTIVLMICLALFGHAVGFTSPWFALIAMFNFLGFIAFARPLFLLKVPSVLRKVRSWEASGEFYRAIGVAAFGRLLRGTPLRYLHPLVYLSRYPADISALRAQVEGAEAAHFWAIVLVVPYMVYICLQTWWDAMFWFMVVQIAGNLYPVFHLRWVRGRLDHLLEKRQRRTG